MNLQLVGTMMLMEKRELKTKANNEVWRRIVKFGYVGGFAEFVIKDGFDWKVFQEGKTYQIKGTIEQEKNGQIFVLTECVLTKSA